MQQRIEPSREQMTAASDLASVDDVRSDVAELRGAVDVALQAALEALQRVQQHTQQGDAPPLPALSEDALHERLRAFETFIIGRVREETTQAVESARCAAGRSAGLGEPGVAASSNATASSGRKVELQLEAQRTRTAAAEQRLSQLESKLNALMTDVVAQAQREAAHHKQLAAMVAEEVDAEVRVVAASLERVVHSATSAQRESLSVAPPDAAREVVSVSALQHVTTALAAMHARVEEQHTELTRWQQQQFNLMEAMALQLTELKAENAALWQMVDRLQHQQQQQQQQQQERS